MAEAARAEAIELQPPLLQSRCNVQGWETAFDWVSTTLQSENFRGGKHTNRGIVIGNVDARISEQLLIIVCTLSPLAVDLRVSGGPSLITSLRNL
jgi:hypothetical protein